MSIKRDNPRQSRSEKSTSRREGANPAEEDSLFSTDDAGAENKACPEDSGTLPSRKGLLRSAMVLFLVLTHISAFMLGYYVTPPNTNNVISDGGNVAKELPQASKQLGPQGQGFDSAAQAQALLRLMVEKSGCKIYQLFFKIGADSFELSANLDEQTLTRTSFLPQGGGGVERWEGEVLERLQNAVSGKNFLLEGEAGGFAESPGFQ